jgi:hypothetical protein
MGWNLVGVVTSTDAIELLPFVVVNFWSETIQLGDSRVAADVTVDGGGEFPVSG